MELKSGIILVKRVGIGNDKKQVDSDSSFLLNFEIKLNLQYIILNLNILFGTIYYFGPVKDDEYTAW